MEKSFSGVDHAILGQPVLLAVLGGGSFCDGMSDLLLERAIEFIEELLRDSWELEDWVIDKADNILTDWRELKAVEDDRNN